MKIPSSNLEAFYVLSQERNFTKAARRIGLSQPAFSQRIIALEKFLETTLVIREKQNISLTEVGQNLLNYCSINSQIEEEFLSQVSNTKSVEGLSGQIRIAGFSSIMRSVLTPSLVNTLNENPNLSIQTFTDELENIPQYLKNSKADFILFNKPIQKEGIKYEFLGIEENVLVSSRRFKDINIFLDHDENDVTTSSYFKLLKKNIPKNKRYLDDVYGLLDGVRLGIGKAILPKHLIQNIKHLEIENPKIILKVPVYLIYNEAPYYTSIQQTVIKEVINGFKSTLSIK
jgi:DNA-binding transcriptional LysR family regulator